MSKNKKKDKKHKKHASVPEDLNSVVRALRAENETLRARLEKIAELAGDLPVQDDEEDEYQEMTHDLDEEVKEGTPGGGQNGMPI